ncbi:hypothetical protein EMCRGX_G028911 [Ephydatia muelleri]|eukprot:Em0013g1126a
MHRYAVHWYILFACFGLVIRPRDAQTCRQFTTAPVDVAAIIGEQVYLFCDYPGSASEAWSTDNGVAIQLSPPNLCNCIPQANGTGSALYFPQVGSGDYKNYTCSAQIGFGVSCRVTAAIRAAVPPVLTAVGNTSQTVAQGSTVTFSVSLTNPGLPLANVVWSKDGVPLSNTSNMVVTSTTLQLSNLTVLNRGRYVATATNKAGSSTTNFDLFVNYLTLMPIVSNTVPGSSSRQIQLTCLAEGYPRIGSIVWRRNTVVQQSAFTLVDPYTWTASTSLLVDVDCMQTYQCVVTSTEQSLLPMQQNASACPSTVSSLSTKPVGSNSVLLLWQPIQMVSSYTVMYKVSGSSLYVDGPRVSCDTACNVTVTGLTLGLLYIFTLGYSSIQMVTATAIIVPGLSPVTGVSAFFTGDSSLNRVTLTWHEVPKASGYLIYVNDATFSDTLTSATTATILLSCGERYKLQVQAYNDVSLSSLSASVQVPLDFCSSSPRIASVATSGGALRVQLANVLSVAAIEITVVEDSGELYSYEVPSGLTEACLDDLSPNVLYTVCAMFMVGKGNSQDCYPNKVSLDRSTAGVSCGVVLVSKSVLGSRVVTLSAPTASQPWVIGLGLVGTLGVLATLSCIAVFLYVKRTEKDATLNSNVLSTATSPFIVTEKSDGQKSCKWLCTLCVSSSHNILWDQHADTLERLGSTGTQV